MSELFDDLFDRKIPADAIDDFLGELRKIAQEGSPLEHAARARVKEAVSADWVASTARQAARNASPSRLEQAASGSMKGVLDAVKRKGPNAQAHIDKRMALHNSLQARSASVRPQKVAADKIAISANFMRQAAQNASPERLAGARNAAVSHAHQIAKRATGSINDAKAYRNQHRFAGVLEEQLSRKAAAFDALQPTPEQIAMAEQQGLLYQTLQENQALHQELETTQGQAMEQAQAGEAMQMQAQETEQALMQAQEAAAQTQAQAQEAMAQAQEAQTEAQVHAQNAAQQADGKMRLAIRIQQMRQQMADLASQDPVAEEGEQAEPIQTATQQGAMEEEALMQEQAAAEQGAAPAAGGGQQAAKPSPKAEKTAQAYLVRARANELAGNTQLAALSRAKAAAAIQLGAAKDVMGRATQLATGGRMTALLGSAERNAARAAKLDPSQYIGDAKDLKRVSAVRAKLEARAAKLKGQALQESQINPAQEVARMRSAQQPGIVGRMFGRKPAAAQAPVANPTTVNHAMPNAQAPTVAPASTPAAAPATPAAAPGRGYGRAAAIGAGGLALGAGGMYLASQRPQPQPQVALPKVASSEEDWDDHPAMRRGRNRATLAGVVPGATAGFIASQLPKAFGGTGYDSAAATSLGAALGALHGRARFNADESKRDIGVVRALAKERAGRMVRENEKQALAASLSDRDIDALLEQ